MAISNKLIFLPQFMPH